jgi:hypothetical protein
VSADGADIHNSCPDYADLQKRLRMSIYSEGESLVIKQIQHISRPIGGRWGGTKGRHMSDVPALDQILGSSTNTLLRGMGVSALGTQKELGVGTRDFLAIRWPKSSGYDVAFAVQALTRVLPIYRTYEVEHG